MNTEKLKDLQKQFTEELQRLNEQAKTEDEYDELESIALDVVCHIPITILQTDYYARSNIREYIEADTKQLDKFMNVLYNNDTISFNYDDMNDTIQDMADNITKGDD